MKTWNVLAERHGRPRIQKWNDARKHKLRARLKEYPDLWDRLEAEFARLNSFARESRWLTFDWVLSTSNLHKLLEGNYRHEAETTQEDDDVERQFREIEQRKANGER